MSQFLSFSANREVGRFGLSCGLRLPREVPFVRIDEQTDEPAKR